MKRLKYICYKNTNKGFLLTRNPKLVEKELTISFSNAPQNATAIFSNEEGTNLYRDLKDNACVIPLQFLVGEIKVAVADLGDSLADRCLCESFYAERKGELLFVYPNGMDMPVQVVELYGELQKLKTELLKRDAKLSQLEKRVESYEKNGIELVFEEEGVENND